MNEEVKIPTKEELLGEVPVQEESPVVSGEPEAPAYSDVERRAIDLGWTPKDQWHGNPIDWRPADVWLDRGEMLRNISELKTKLSATERQVAEAFKKGEQMAEVKFKEQITALKLARREAFQEGDFARADQIEERIDELKEEKEKQQTVSKAQGTPNVPPEFPIFLQRNPWYTTNKRLRYMADSVGREYIEANPNATPADLYFFVEQEMAQFTSGKSEPKKSPPVPEGGKQVASRTGASGSGGSLSSVEASMNELERGIMNTMVKTGAFKNKEEYLREYAKIAK